MVGKLVSICSWFSLLLRGNWGTADSGAASSRRNRMGVMFPECLYTPQSDGIAPGTSCLLSRHALRSQSLLACVGCAPSRLHSRGPGSRLAWKRVRATNSSTGSRGKTGTGKSGPTWGGCGYVKGRISCILRCWEPKNRISLPPGLGISWAADFGRVVLNFIASVLPRGPVLVLKTLHSLQLMWMSLTHAQGMRLQQLPCKLLLDLKS